MDSPIYRSGPRLDAALAVCSGLAVVSLLLPFAPAYDSWSWLVWGRELASLSLDTAAGPSWKPLPVLVAAPLSIFGDAAVALWLVVARTAWLMALVLGFRVAAALLDQAAGRAARVTAGLIAALSIMLVDDPEAPWLRHFAHGLSEPLLVGLLLLAVDRHLGSRPGQALAALALAGLVRPEAWVLGAAYLGVWVWRGSSRLRAWGVLAVTLGPLLWFAGDLLGSGDPLTGPGRAMLGDASAPVTLGERLGAAAEVVAAGLATVPLVVWPLVVVALVLGSPGPPRSLNTLHRLEEHTVQTASRVLGAGALVWIAVVALEAAAGFAPLARFALPAAALLCVIGGVGAGLAAARIQPLWGAPFLLSVLAVALVLPRAPELHHEYLTAAERGRISAELTDALQTSTPSNCPPITTDDFLAAPQIAWVLELPLGEVGVKARSLPTTGSFVERRSAPAAPWRISRYVC